MGMVVLFATACGSFSGSSSSSNSSAAQPQSAAPASVASATVTPVASAPQSTLLMGNAHPKYPVGTPGRIGVVYQAPIQPATAGTLVPIVLRNNTSAAVAHVQVSATAKDPGGKIVASGASQGTDPSVIQPGQWAFAYVYFEPGSALASDNTLSLAFQSMPASTSPFNTAAMQVTQANLSGSSIAGSVQNTTGSPVQGPIAVNVYCLSSAGDPTSVITGFTSNSISDLAPNDSASFQLSLYGKECSSFLVGASGYYK